MEKRTLAIFAVSCNLFLSTSLFAQQQRVDTACTYYIPEITVSDIYQTREVRSTAPLQIFSKDALKNLNALQVSDAVKHFAGVTVKDYGGDRRTENDIHTKSGCATYCCRLRRNHTD